MMTDHMLIEYAQSSFKMSKEQAARWYALMYGGVDAIPDGLHVYLSSVSESIGMCRDIAADSVAAWIKAGEPTDMEYKL